MTLICEEPPRDVTTLISQWLFLVMTACFGVGSIALVHVWSDDVPRVALCLTLVGVISLMGSWLLWCEIRNPHRERVVVDVANRKVSYVPNAGLIRWPTSRRTAITIAFSDIVSTEPSGETVCVCTSHDQLTIPNTVSNFDELVTVLLQHTAGRPPPFFRLGRREVIVIGFTGVLILLFVLAVKYEKASEPIISWLMAPL